MNKHFLISICLFLSGISVFGQNHGIATSKKENQGIINTTLGLTPSGTKLHDGKPLMGDDGILYIFAMENGIDFRNIIVYESRNGGLNFNEAKRICSIDATKGEWLSFEATRDKNGHYHFFHLFRRPPIQAADMKNHRTEGDFILGDPHRGQHLIDIWHHKCNASFEEFTKPRKIMNGYTGALNSCITLKNGRIILPFSYVKNRSWSNRDLQMPQFSYYGFFNCVVLYSDDCGETFSLSNSVWVPTPNLSTYGGIEPVCFERSDGSVDMIIRTQMGVFYRSTSKDGSHFSMPEPTTIINSDSPAGIVCIDGKTILFYNSCKRYPYAYGGRHVLHAAISDDYLLTLRGGREVVRDKHNYDPPPTRGDFGTAYSFPCALPDGRIIFFTGQGEDRVSFNILDPSWLEQTNYVADFQNKAYEWHHFGVDNITVDASGVTIRPSQDAFESVVWNFPALFRGRIVMEFDSYKLPETITLLLTDHFSTPFDEADWLDCVFEVPIRLENGRTKVELEFDSKTGLLQVYCNGALQKSDLPAWKLTRNGVNYLRVKTPKFQNKDGWIKLTNAFTEEYSSVKDYEGYCIFNKAEPLTFLQRSKGPMMRLSNGSIFSILAETREVSYSISNDEGITWTEYPLFDAEKFSIINPVFVQTRKGTIIIAFSNMSEITPFLWNNDTNRPDNDVKLPTYVIRSQDNGKTWSEPLKLHDNWTGFNRTMIETKDGHIVLSTMIMRNNPSRHCVLTYVSSDDGATWTPSTVLDSPSSTGHHAGLKEADIIQLNDGRLWMVIRTNWDYFYESYSSDNGLTWSAFCKTDIDSSSSPCGIIRLQSGRIVMVWNRLYQKGKDDIKRAGGDKNWSEVATSLQRDELSLMYSDDDGKTWSAPFIIAENSPQNAGKWLSYPYLFEPKKGVIWITTMQGNLKIAFREDDLPK